MTNKIITVVSFALAIVAIMWCFIQDVTTIVLVGLGVIILALIMFHIERKLSQSGNDIINRIIYIFTKAENYEIIHKAITYEYLSKNEMLFTKDYCMYPLKEGKEIFDDRYCWSSINGDVVIKEKYPGQTIKYIREKDIWVYFTISFNRHYKKRDQINTGAIISNLIDKEGKCKPFLTITIREKTKCVKMVAKIPKSLNPVNAKYEVYHLNDCDNIIDSGSLAYNNLESGFTKTINYPRKHYGYAIVWEWGATT